MVLLVVLQYGLQGEGENELNHRFPHLSRQAQTFIFLCEIR